MPGDEMRMPFADASKTPTRTLTLGDLRRLVAAADGLPHSLIVRGNAIPFKMSDLGNRKGACMMTLAIDEPEEGKK
jgi:hypothetical protein